MDLEIQPSSHRSDNAPHSSIGAAVLKVYNRPDGCRNPADNGTLQSQTKNTGDDPSPKQKGKPR